jgi:hypothetical protein
MMSDDDRRIGAIHHHHHHEYYNTRRISLIRIIHPHQHQEAKQNLRPWFQTAKILDHHRSRRARQKDPIWTERIHRRHHRHKTAIVASQEQNPMIHLLLHHPDGTDDC